MNHMVIDLQKELMGFYEVIGKLSGFSSVEDISTCKQLQKLIKKPM